MTISILIGVTGCSGKFRNGNFVDKMFSKFDEDKDGFVDKTEYFAISTSRFERSDDNNDGKVSKKESLDTFIAKRFPSKVKKWFKNSDSDNKIVGISNSIPLLIEIIMGSFKPKLFKEV